jgi:hypothetical protein
MNYAYLVASGLGAFALVLHVMTGRRHTVFPNRRSDSLVPGLARDAAYGRHLTTLLLLGMTAGFGQLARMEEPGALPLILSGVALVAAILRFIIAIGARAPRLDISEWGLIFAGGAVGLVGALS